MSPRFFTAYSDALHKTLSSARASAGDSAEISMDEGMARVRAEMARIARGANKVMFIGNGGSAGIAGHMAIDFTKNGGVRSLTFNDASSLTCLGNDLGYDQVFAKQVEMLGAEGDVLISISSSGESKNILNAVEAARARGCFVVTLSGFSESNALRQTGDVNFYVDARIYGMVETSHQTILHAILDTAMGWTEETAMEQPTQSVI
jgi:D-sedoheptulose 7-phosphate isomerase